MKLPPLKSLPVFEAVARLNSFSRAADELNVSQSAVSHQIKQLETFLGEPLFQRQGRTLALTREGQDYLEGISSALFQIDKATGQLLGRQDSRLRLAVFSSFAVRWLVPRLPDLHRQHPEVQLVLEMTGEHPILSGRVADSFITVNTDSPAFSYDLLYRERLFPVCSRQYWQDMATDSLSHTDVARHPLLSTFSIYNRTCGDWEAWFAEVGSPLPPSTQVQHFSHMLLALEAARYHQGIALTNDYMLSNRDDAGDFVRLPLHSVVTGDNFYFASKISRRHEPGLRALRQWLLARAEDSGLLSADAGGIP
ncbi:LysR substrate-binding domain-containing protein [Marinobacter zhanjiangensis]|uniref:LysR family transcriptional regulator n=1 Tax=Marinobacter zhanjiangensis TaxID=578215 RepID=A0ABQ3BE20_9GAMM|nr:LysR substrate-binding domain-containing protein [Marinobacter zhanjiangensis]GGY86085.1 LysR family transcriptional regulator [Marinobacter zhanjiangensis]